MKVRIATLACVAIVWTAACGASSDAGEPSLFDTGLPERKPMTELTADEARQICEQIAEWFESDYGVAKQLEVLCARSALLSTDTIVACEEAKRECMAHFPIDAIPAVPTNCAHVDATSVQGCYLTVGEFETCQHDYRLARRVARTQMNCSLVGDPERIRQAVLDFDFPVEPDSCTAAGCPIFPSF
jgi:hypothetical protein